MAKVYIPAEHVTDELINITSEMANAIIISHADFSMTVFIDEEPHISDLLLDDNILF